MDALVEPAGAVPDAQAAVRAEVQALGDEALARSLPGVMGGLAVWLTCPSVRVAPLARTYPDIDLAADSRASRPLTGLLVERGYEPEELFNAIHGAQRLNFRHVAGAWTIDVLLDELRMSHRISFRGRLSTTGPTIDLADLLLTKLQVWEFNAKDVGDALAILGDHALIHNGGVPTTDALDVDRLTAVCSSDWGLTHTLDRNLGTVATVAERLAIPTARFSPADAARAIAAALEAAPKSMRWRARARVGERVAWYETPEEVRR